MNGYQVYRRTQAQTASPAELVVMLYRGAVRFATAGGDALETRNLEAAHNNLVRAQAIVSELASSLDVDHGGEIARNLLGLYGYVNRCLVEANVRKSVEPAREAQRLLRDLLEAWEEAARQPSPGGSAAAVAA